MKCFTCGYEKHGNLGKNQDVPVYYQRGSKQGQLKETRREWVDPEKDMPDFFEMEAILRSSRNFGCYGWEADPREVLLYACPKCGTVRLSDNYLEE